MPSTAAVDQSEHYLHSSYRESFLEHLFLATLMTSLWPRRLEVLKPQVDDSGYDVVLESNGVLRYVQLKSTVAGSRVPQVTVNIRLFQKLNACVVLLVFDDRGHEKGLSGFRWFGKPPGLPLGDPADFAVAQRKLRNIERVKTPRPNVRVVTPSHFATVGTVPALLNLLFGYPDAS